MSSEAVWSRLIVPLFSGQSRSCCLPGTDGLKRRLVREGALWVVLVAELLVTFQGALQVFVCAESSGGKYIADPAAEALDPDARLRLLPLDQAVLDVEQCALAGEDALLAALLRMACQAVRELDVVVGQQLLDLHRGGGQQAAQKVGASGFILIAMDAHEDPARSPVDGDKQIPSDGVLRYLRLALDMRIWRANVRLVPSR